MQGFDPMQNARLQTAMLPVLLDVALLSHIINSLARKPSGAPLGASSLSLPVQPPMGLTDLGGLVGHASAPFPMGKPGSRNAQEARMVPALPPAKRAVAPLPPPICQQSPGPSWAPLHPCNSSLRSSETCLDVFRSARPGPDRERRCELDLDLMRSSTGTQSGPNAFAWPPEEAPHPFQQQPQQQQQPRQQLPPPGADSAAAPEGLPGLGLLGSHLDPRTGHAEALWPDASCLDGFQASLGIEEAAADWLDMPGSLGSLAGLQGLQGLALPATSLEQQLNLRLQAQQEAQGQAHQPQRDPQPQAQHQQGGAHRGWPGGPQGPAWGAGGSFAGLFPV